MPVDFVFQGEMGQNVRATRANAWRQFGFAKPNFCSRKSAIRKLPFLKELRGKLLALYASVKDKHRNGHQAAQNKDNGSDEQAADRDSTAPIHVVNFHPSSGSQASGISFVTAGLALARVKLGSWVSATG